MLFAREPQDALDQLAREWTGASPADAETEFAQVLDEWARFEWQSGSKTLMSALGLQYQEVPLCRGLAWLFDPEGGHRLGTHALDAFLLDLDMQPVQEDEDVEIQVEVTRADTRADIVIRIGRRTVVIEAKVFAGEQPTQAERLSELWADATPTLVFLTQKGGRPATATGSSDRWQVQTWGHLATTIRNIIDGRDDFRPSAGARDFLETIGALG